MRKKNGFTLVEIIVALGLLSSVALVFMNLNKQSMQMMVKSKVDQESLLINNEIISILSNPINCTATLVGLNAQTTAAGTILNIKSNGTARYAVNSSYGDANLLIKSYSISASDSDVGLASNTTKLIINFQRKKMQTGTGDIVKKIRLFVNFDASNNITFCRSLSASSTDIWTRGNAGIIHYSGGDVGINQPSPAARLDINGEVKISSSGVACSTSNEGSMRYNSSSKNMEFCNGTIWKQIGGGSDFTTPPASSSRYCILMTSCPAGWTDRGMVGIIAHYGWGFGSCGSGQLGLTGGDFNGGWGWCHPRICCNN